MQENSSLYATMRPASGGRSLVTLSTYEERQEALRRTTIMEDDVNHRTSRNFSADLRNTSNDKLLNGNDVRATTAAAHPSGQQQQQQQQQQIHIPPPPPQFANSPPKSYQSGVLNKPLQSTQQHSGNTPAVVQHNARDLKPPSSPVPDYDNVQMRSSISRSAAYTSSYLTSSTFNPVTNGRVEQSTALPAQQSTGTGNRRTLRLGTVTIGEYEHQQQRKEPGKFDFMLPAQKRSPHSNNNSPGNSNNDAIQAADSLRSELQNTLSRSNLKKTNGHLEQQRDYPVQSENYESHEFQNGTGSVDNLTRKLQGTSLSNRSVVNGGDTASTVVGKRNSGGANGIGILKNGNRNSGGGGTSISTGGSGGNGVSFTKSSDKTITFGN